MDIRYFVNNKLHTRQDFIVFLGMLSEDFKKNPKEWENNTLELFLETFETVAEDVTGYYKNMGMPFPENPTWKLFAELFMMAKVYE